MTVCMLIWDYWPGQQGGAQRQCRKIAHALSEKGIQVEIITQRRRWFDRRKLHDHGTTVTRLGGLAPLAAIGIRLKEKKTRWIIQSGSGTPSGVQGRRWGVTMPFWWMARWSFMAAAEKYILNHRDRFDIIHVHEANWIAGFAARTAAGAGRPSVCKVATQPCLDTMGPDVPWRRELSVWRRRQHFIALNSGMGEELRSAGIEADRVHLLPNGVDIPTNQADPTKNRRVLFVANFSQGAHWKAYDILLEAWRRVQDRNASARLWLAGAGDSLPWRQLAEKLGCGGSMDFLGPVPDPERLYAQAAVFVLPSRVEGMSNSLLESQSWGVPAVVSDIPGNRAVVTHGENGLLCPVDDAEALAAAILRLLGDPPLRSRLGNQARQRIINEFSLAKVTSRLIELYRFLSPPNSR